jgi:coproporphyrinogen III oxidase-like Fe-S oxidoreductase
VYVYRASPGTVMASQIGRGRRDPTRLNHLLELYHASQRILTSAGYAEDAVGYFSRSPERRFLSEEYYFDLLGDYVGFGSGASSIIAHHLVRNLAGNLQTFLQGPTGFDSFQRFHSGDLESFFPSLRLTLTSARGINFKRFQQLFGFEFSEARRQTLLSSYLDYYRWCGAEYIETDENLSVSAKTRATAYIASLIPAARIISERPLGGAPAPSQGATA